MRGGGPSTTPVTSKALEMKATQGSGLTLGNGEMGNGDTCVLRVLDKPCLGQGGGGRGVGTRPLVVGSVSLWRRLLASHP